MEARGLRGGLSPWEGMQKGEVGGRGGAPGLGWEPSRAGEDTF